MELIIAVCLLGSDRWRKVALVFDVMLHGMIIVTMGLWSFAPVMIGCPVVAAMPASVAPQAEEPGELHAGKPEFARSPAELGTA